MKRLHQKLLSGLSFIFQGHTPFKSFWLKAVLEKKCYQKIISTLNEIATECEKFFEKKFKFSADTLAAQNEAKAKAKAKNENKSDKILEYEHVINFELPCLLMIREIILNQS